MLVIQTQIAENPLWAAELLLSAAVVEENLQLVAMILVVVAAKVIV